MLKHFLNELNCILIDYDSMFSEFYCVHPFNRKNDVTDAKSDITSHGWCIGIVLTSAGLTIR